VVVAVQLAVFRQIKETVEPGDLAVAVDVLALVLEDLAHLVKEITEELVTALGPVAVAVARIYLAQMELHQVEMEELE
jgi:hypothetical protein